MNTLNTINIEALAEQIVRRLTVEVEASGRHVHLSRADLDTLFGPGFQLTRVKDLSQPGQFVCAQRVTLEGPRRANPREKGYLTALTIASNAFGSFIARSASTLRLRTIPLALSLPMNCE